MKPAFLVILGALTSLPALAGTIEHKPWQDRTLDLSTLKLDSEAHVLSVKTDEGISLTVSCERRSRGLFHPIDPPYALKTREVGDTTSECEAHKEAYMSLDQCMTKLGTVAQEMRARAVYYVFNDIPSDVGMWCSDKTDYVEKELDREHK